MATIFMLGLVLLIILNQIYFNEAKSRVLVVGANGRVGRATVQSLLQNGVAVRALVRKTFPSDQMPAGSDVEVVIGDVTNVESVKKATSGNISAVVDVHGMAPPRLTKFTDLFTQESSDMSHPYNVNYQGVKNLLDGIKSNPSISKYVRITGALVGKDPFSNIFIPLFNLILSFSSKWHEMSEILIRESGVAYTVIRPTGIKDEPTASESGKTLLMVQGDDPKAKVPIPGSISCRDLGVLCSLLSCNAATLERCTVVVSTTSGTKNKWEDLFGSIKKDWAVMKPSPHRAAVAVFVATIASFLSLTLYGLNSIFSFLVRTFFH